ncbi:RelA/SpoT domain protein [Caldalkalibacillus thermarum TA2.A1]|uniref:GTP diphosphokinase n=1 Tax=Caldalkalibacillus thermarum (strain TA2.A1) TaxID=986075 RepID=F5L508_CALTT|nr:GTP pyrophosphokinase family protein [Caldalkalibacillus thermarum]EGL83584.1 RelA/SpoT domain protein [Caldalkalibacillus thermarum TA2.A1]QZT35116.1 GTP pyrophosphokinase family protein [Caldalkalibacillus thermarum TA2.A1]GGK12602.1 GTP pyrophosphokinase [Caldalkalibacillus thermarum]
MPINWEKELIPFHQAVEELKIKFKGIREEYLSMGIHSPIELVMGRVKPVPSILQKAARKNIPEDQILKRMKDIAGIRIICQFVDDIYSVVKLIKQRNDLKVLGEKDYVREQKESGYRSYHIVIEYPIHTVSGPRNILVEIQIRTLSMNFWATIEHSLNYKYGGEIPTHIQKRLQRAAEASFLLDEEMSKIKDEIQEAQKAFAKKNTRNR